jgi:pilus assembly protein CpaE
MTFNPKLLIIDEGQDSRVEARRAAARGGMQVAGEVGFGTEGVTLAHQTEPDVILLAVEEPVTRALETAEALANVLPETPLIFYSSLKEPEAVRRGVLYGARDYLFKPLQGTALRDSVMRALKSEEKRQARLSGELRDADVRGTVITVAGAKGGIGKSVIAVNLALSLRMITGNRVAIVDADTHFGDVATMLDLRPEVTLTQAEKELDTLDRHTINDYLTPQAQGLMVFSAPIDEDDAWTRAGPPAARKIVDLLALNYDFVVVDTSGAMDAFVREVTDVSTLVLLVTTGEVSSVRDTRGALARLAKWDVPEDKIKLVLNRGARADGFQAGDLETTLGRKVFWELPRDRAVSLSIQVGEPVVISKPGSEASKSLLGLATLIGGNAHGEPERKPAGSFKLFRGRGDKLARKAVS